MRKPLNDTGREKLGADPHRKCILSGESRPAEELVRLAISPDGDVLPDLLGKAPGRGAWLGCDRPTLETAMAKGQLRGALARSFKGAKLTVPDDLADRIAQGLERVTLDRLGLESRAGQLVTGTEKIDVAARRGKLAMLLHAADAAVDGTARLDQAWRVGSEDMSVRSISLPVGREPLSLALGRGNVVHIGVTDMRAARRISHHLDRWCRFIGPSPDNESGEVAA